MAAAAVPDPTNLWHCRKRSLIGEMHDAKLWASYIEGTRCRIVWYRGGDEASDGPIVRPVEAWNARERRRACYL